jgi:hypothetical protein
VPIGHFASGLDNAGGTAQAWGVELWIAHALAIGFETMETATSQIAASIPPVESGRENRAGGTITLPRPEPGFAQA